MLVDDDQNTVKLLQMLLEMDGFEVIIAPNSESAMEQAKEVKPDAFLVDYHLSDASGADLVRDLRSEKAFSKVPIIMTSGLDHSDEAIEIGASEFLLKPFEPNDLSGRLKALLDVS